MLGEKKKKKVQGNTKSSSTVKSLSVCLLIYLGPFFDILFSVQDFEVIPKPFWSKREKVIYLCCPVWHFPLATTSDSKPVFVLFGMVGLSSLSPPHWAENLCCFEDK